MEMLIRTVVEALTRMDTVPGMGGAVYSSNDSTCNECTHGSCPIEVDEVETCSHVSENPGDGSACSSYR